MSNLSDLLPAGAGAKSATFTASGTLSSGQTVVLNSDGTVEAVASSGNPFSAGSPVVVDSDAPTEGLALVYDSSNNKVVVVYSDAGNSNYGTAVVGTVSGTSISFGSPVVFNSGNTEKVGAVFDSNSNKVVPIWSQVVGTSLIAIVGTVSGTSISFGSSATFSSDGTASPLKAAFDSSSNKVVVAYRDDGNSDYGTAIVGTVSGTSISFGTSTVFQSSSVSHFGIAFDSNANKTVIGFQASDVGYGIVGTVSGTSISFGTRAAMDGSNNAERLFLTFDSTNNKVVFGYTARDDSESGAAIVGTVSGTSISFGTPSFFIGAGTGNYQMQGIAFDSSADKIVFSTRFESSPQQIDLTSASVSGTSLVFGDSNVAASGAASAFAPLVYDTSADKVVCAYNDGANSGRTTALVTVVDTFATNSADFVGITDQAIANTATGSVVVEGGVTEKLSGLTTGSTYYVQNDGSLSTTSSSVTAGKALSSTTLLLKG